tara:strand:+ start:7829 stop:8545 length:717 start_codon:yes stop_codon:yes gene_type:complete
MAYLGMIFLLFAHVALAVDFGSGTAQTTVIELYTSEGCSSCPPADKWLSTLKEEPTLFKDIIPMAFHVDYWDQLGWKDPWAQAAFADRQRQLAQQRNLSQVYTPAVLVASNEWRTWYKGSQLPKLKSVKAGVLSAHLNGQLLTVHYSEQGDYELNIAYLGMGLVSKVTAGENRSRTLIHDFVVLNHLKQKGASSWKVTLPNIEDYGQQRTAISVWLSKQGTLDIEQAAASFIELDGCL